VSHIRWFWEFEFCWTA